MLPASLPSPLGAEGLASYTSVRWTAVGGTDEVDRVVHCSAIPCLPLWGRWTAVGGTEEVPGRSLPSPSGEGGICEANDGRGRSPRHGGLPAGTIERARLTAMWAAGEVPGSEGKPPKRLRPSFPFTEWKRFTRNPRQKSNVPCRDGDFWRFAFQTRTAARAHHAVALPCPNGLGRQTAVTGGAPPPQAVPLPTAVRRLWGVTSDRI